MKKRYMGGGDIDAVGLEKYVDPYSRPKAPSKKPLPSEITKEDKPAFDKYVREPAKKFSDKVSDFADKHGLANPMEVVNEALGGETREESKARRAGMPTSKVGKSMKSGGSVSSASKRADGCAIRGKTKGRMV